MVAASARMAVRSAANEPSGLPLIRPAITPATDATAQQAGVPAPFHSGYNSTLPGHPTDSPVNLCTGRVPQRYRREPADPR